MEKEGALQPQNTVVNDEDEGITMAELLAESELVNPPKKGEIREGVVASVSGDEILISIGAKSEGVIPSREVEQLTEEDREKLIVGTEVSVYVVNPETQGTLLLSITRALEEDDWTNAENLMKSKEIHEGVIEGYNKGGLIVNLGRLRGFIPASQVSMTRRMAYRGNTPEQRWGKMIDETILTRVIEVDRHRRRLILSEKAASSETRESLKERLLEELEVNDVRKGKVTSLADFGAFVNINGADGLVHLSEISWERLKHPSEILKVGQEVDVKVISIDKERNRIGLSIRQLESDPWFAKAGALKEGQLIKGTITRLTKFGAFARIDDEMEGLIHVSEISEQRIEHPKEELKVGDEMTLRVIKIDEDRRRVGLSVRKVESRQYMDMDWELTLAELNEEDTAKEAEEVEAVEEAAAEAVEEPTEEAEAEDEPEAEAVEEAAAEVVEEPAKEVEAEAVEETMAKAVEEVEETTAEVVEEPTEETEDEDEPEAEEAPETPEEEPSEEEA